MSRQASAVNFRRQRRRHDNMVADPYAGNFGAHFEALWEASGMTPEIIKTEKLTLRPLTLADADDLFLLYSDQEAVRYMPEPAHEQVEQTRATLEDMMARKHACYWAICGPESGQAFGFVGFLGKDDDFSGAGYGLRRDMWHRGLGSEALAVITEVGFNDFGIGRIELWIDRRNTGSRGVAKRVGYEQRASFFQKYPHEETAHNTIVYGLYRSDWLQGRANDPALITPEPMNKLEPVLSVPDVEEAIRYYCDVLGFKVGFRSGDPVDHAGVSLGDWSFQETVIQFSQAASGGSLSLSGHIYIHTGEDADLLFRRLKASGANLSGEPEQKPWGRKEFDLTDLNGYRFRFGSIS